MKFLISHRAVAVLGLLALAACDTGREITPATFVQTPSATEMRAAYPTFARLAGIEGKVWMHCAYTLEGALERCRKKGVAPEGLNFDRPVGRLLAYYVVDPQRIDGRAAPGEIDFVIHFAPPPPPPAWTGAPITDAERRQALRVVDSQLLQFDEYGERGNAHRTVDIDRYQPVATMLDEAFAAEADARRDALATAFVQAMTPAFRREFLSPRAAFRGVTAYEMETVSPELYAVNARIAERIRAQYCAAYSCAVTPPAP